MPKSISDVDIKILKKLKETIRTKQRNYKSNYGKVPNN